MRLHILTLIFLKIIVSFQILNVHPRRQMVVFKRLQPTEPFQRSQPFYWSRLRPLLVNLMSLRRTIWRILPDLPLGLMVTHIYLRLGPHWLIFTLNRFFEISDVVS